MLAIEPTDAVLGATVRGIDVARPLCEPDLERILLALSKHGVLRFPDQYLDLGALKRFAEQCGTIQGDGNREHDPRQTYPESTFCRTSRERQIHRQPGCRPGLAHRHDPSRGAGVRERAVWHPHPAS
jgi:alpha-ketoglutarate-dependent taurine dioxygenase